MSGRFFLIALSLIAVTLPAGIRTAEAFWGFGEGKSIERSGLDLNGGYDRNTVTSVSGKVVSLVFDEEHPPNLIVVQENGATIHLVVGPHRFWSEKGIALKAGDDVTARGAKAQGRDGNTYLLVQRLKSLTNGTEVTLRDDSGRPAWSGGRDGGGSGGSRMNRDASPMRRGGGRQGR